MLCYVPSLAASYWQRYCTTVEQWARAKLCGVEHRAPPIFDRATITLGIGPHSSFILTRNHASNCGRFTGEGRQTITPVAADDVDAGRVAMTTVSSAPRALVDVRLADATRVPGTGAVAVVKAGDRVPLTGAVVRARLTSAAEYRLGAVGAGPR